jgi:hypothetical protein
MRRIDELLASRPYPGRGVLVARTLNGSRCFAYFVTGRSEASQRRRLVVRDGGEIAVEDSASGNASDPLRHYVAAVARGKVVVVGNGSHVTPIADVELIRCKRSRLIPTNRMIRCSPHASGLQPQRAGMLDCSWEVSRAAKARTVRRFAACGRSGI